MSTTGLVKVTIAAPRRRIDMALPERSPLAELLPGLLRHAGETLADDGVGDGGWLLRRGDGAVLDGAQALGTHGVQDGEVLHLVPRRLQWPELEYDDLADAIATGAGRTGRLWAPRHTRLAGLAVAVVAVLLALAAMLRAGPPWTATAWAALAAAVVLLVIGTALARAFGDAGAGSVIAVLALPFAFTGGALLLGGALTLSQFAAPQVLAGSAALLLAAVLGYLGVVDRAALFVGGATVGVLGVLGGWMAGTDALDGVDAAAVVAGAVLLFSPLFGPLTVRMARVPMPVLPRTPADLVRDDPQPPRHAVYATVLRASDLLTGLVGGAALVTVACAVLLVSEPSTSVVVLLVVLTLGLCLRARLYPAVRQRMPLLAAGLSAAMALAVGPLMANPDRLLVVSAPVLVVVGMLAVSLGLSHSKRPPSAFFARYAEILEVVLVLTCVPVVCAVLGLFGLVRGLGG